MITYTLICAKGHEHSDTFDNYDDYQTQAKAKTLACPTCGSHDIEKGLSAPNVGKSAAPDIAPCGAPNGCMGGACGLG